MKKKVCLLVSILGFFLLIQDCSPVFAACGRLGDACAPASPCCIGLTCKGGICASVFGKVEHPYGLYGATGLGAFLNNIVSGVTITAGILLFLYLIFGGFKYMTAGGDEKAVQTAQKIMTNAVIGLIIIAGAWFIVKIVETILGIKILEEPVFTGP